MHGGRHRDLGQTGGHELQERHLRGGVLHGDAVGAEVGVGLASLELLVLGIVEVVDEDLLGQREAATEPAPTDGHAFARAWRRRRSTSSMGVVAVDGHGVLHALAAMLCPSTIQVYDK